MAANTQAGSRSDLSALRRGAIIAYRWLILGFVLVGGVQIFPGRPGRVRLPRPGRAAGSSAHSGSM